MKDYNYEFYRECFKDKFNKLLEHYYKAEKNCRRRGLFLKEFEEKYNYSLGETIKNWFKTNEFNKSAPSIKTLIDICNFFKCDLDYFFTEQTYFCSAFNHASQYIGLDYETVERISKYSPEEKEILNVSIYKNHIDCNNPLLKNADYFKKLIESIEKYSISDHVSSITVKNLITNKEEKLSRITDSDRIEAINREDPRNKLETLLNCIYNEYFSVTEKMSDDKLEEMGRAIKQGRAEIENQKGGD